MDSVLGHLFYALGLQVCFSHNHAICVLVVYLDVGDAGASRLALSAQNGVGHTGSVLSSSVKEVIGILKGIALNL